MDDIYPCARLRAAGLIQSMYIQQAEIGNYFMPMPPFQEFMRPILKCLEDGAPRKSRDITEAMALQFALTPAERNALLPGGSLVIRNRVWLRPPQDLRRPLDELAPPTVAHWTQFAEHDRIERQKHDDRVHRRLIHPELWLCGDCGQCWCHFDTGLEQWTAGSCDLAGPNHIPDGWIR